MATFLVSNSLLRQVSCSSRKHSDGGSCCSDERLREIDSSHEGGNHCSDESCHNGGSPCGSVSRGDFSSSVHRYKSAYQPWDTDSVCGDADHRMKDNVH